MTEPNADDRLAEASALAPTAVELEPEQERVQGSALAGLLALIAGCAVPFLIMACDLHSQVAVPLGFLGCLLACFGIFQVLGTLTSRVPQSSTSGRDLLRAAWPLLVAMTLLTLFLRLAVRGVLPWPRLSNGLLVTSAFIGAVFGVYRLGRALGAWQAEPARSLSERHGFWLTLLCTLLYLPLLGSYSLSDPWEVHYGEVAREMLARDDWLSLWWAQDGWFWSKPILDFWAQGLSFSLFGVGYQPDSMLLGVTQGRVPGPEWAARMPIFVMTLLATYVLYKGVASVFGRRAGFLCGVVLTTLPYWFFLGHQTMTDMPYVAPLTAAFGFMLLAAFVDPEKACQSRQFRIGAWHFELSAYHLLYGVILFCVLPQILYLASRNVTLHLAAAPYGFRPHWDEFFAGSGGGNCGLPGNDACREKSPLNPLWQPVFGAAVWSGVLAWLLLWRRHERRLQRLYYMAAWLCTALAAMAKGAPGLVVPVFAVGVFVVGTRRWRDLARMELLGLGVITACVVLPWYLQMLARHGFPFLSRLLFHDMWDRAFVHVHDTNDGVDTSFRYYVWQLGYGLFPWTGLAAGGLFWWLRHDVVKPRNTTSDARALMALWFVGAFSMFTVSLTKFHHYIAPAVPPVAVLTGLLLDDFLGEQRFPSGRRLARYVLALSGAACLLVYGTLRLFPGAIGGWLVAGQPPDPSRLQAALALLAACGLLVLALRYGASQPAREPSEALGSTDTNPAAAASAATEGTPASATAPAFEFGPAEFRRSVYGVLAIASAVVLGVVGRDFFTIETGNKLGQLRLLHLFTYNYRRLWPKSLNFEGVLLAFVLVLTCVSLLMAVRRLRPHAVALLLVLSGVWTAWGLDVYMVKTAPHWGQRETILAYYKSRSGPEQPLVAYQMNWKGENFYTGNQLAAFVSTKVAFKKWIEEKKQKGTRVMYFMSEHVRINALKNEVGPHRELKLITDEYLNNKFVLARVEF